MPGGYRIEYSSSSRAGCKGPKPCAGTKIAKGELRFGTVVEIQGNSAFQWRHWGCVTKKIFENVKKSIENAEDLDGFADLKPEDQAKIRKAWQDGQVDDADLTANQLPKTAEEAEEEPVKKKRAPKKKKADEEDDEEPEEPAEKPKKKAPAKSKVCLVVGTLRMVVGHAKLARLVEEGC
ncbi:zf-PARP-domain-containing protein [Coprinopsis marcescibilis]|uniref:Zf-PARP-domain-containing protein n=1 Tax=Coprinopsis marcescibilis TaxID=230819 RepID=A0A5C3L6X5_COPMA|nr:zf-PARP-domain-containing protein [Coprinopsis marcescibilis]